VTSQIGSINTATSAAQNEQVNPPRFRRGGFVGFEQGFPPVSRHTRSSSFRVTFVLPVATRRVRI
jgi:hypothetical protein